jgi:hypothetical protein
VHHEAVIDQILFDCDIDAAERVKGGEVDVEALRKPMRVACRSLASSDGLWQQATSEGLWQRAFSRT